MGALYQAFNPDLSGLKARGAKLILWNGTNDTAISPRDTQRYYNRVVEKMGRDAADETVELFLAPGVGHGGQYRLDASRLDLGDASRADRLLHLRDGRREHSLVIDRPGGLV